MNTMYPKANTSLYFARSKSGVTMKPEKIVLHTTEGGSVPGYSGGSSAPNFTVDCLRGVVYQHFPVNMSSRALKNAKGGVETNTDGAVQIEIIGTCDPRSAVNPYVPTLMLSKMGALIDLLVWISKETGIPLVSTPRPWVAYPASYGKRASQRMSFTEWDSFRGVCGHQHVPENDHGDPGSLDVSAILAAARKKGGAQHVTSSSAPKAPGGPASKFPNDPNRELPWGAFPLPSGHWYGVNDRSARSHSGVQAGDRRAVKQIQRLVGVVADGVYGPATKAAVTKWQASKGLTADGLFGSRSWVVAAL